MAVQLAWLFCLSLAVLAIVGAEDPYRFFTWNVTYGDIYPLGVRQTVYYTPYIYIYIYICLLPHTSTMFGCWICLWLVALQIANCNWQGILINGQFPGPDIHSFTNDNLIINVFNSLDEPFLLSWYSPLLSSPLFAFHFIPSFILAATNEHSVSFTINLLTSFPLPVSTISHCFTFPPIHS